MHSLSRFIHVEAYSHFSSCSIVSPLITLKKQMQHQFQSLFHTVFPSLSFSTPQSSTPLWNLERSLTGAQRKTSAVTIQTCTSTWSNTTREVWRMPSPTSRLGLCWLSYSHWLPVLFLMQFSIVFCFVLCSSVLMVHREFLLVCNLKKRTFSAFKITNFLGFYQLSNNIKNKVTFVTTCMHLADAFIQSDLQCIQAIHLYCQYVCSLGIEPTTFALLTQCSNHWATG